MVNLFTQLHFIAAAIYIGIGIYTFHQDRASPSNRLFLILSLCFGFWSYANGLAIAAETAELAWRIFKLFVPLWFLFPPLLLHFSLRLSKHNYPRLQGLLPLLYIPGALIYLLSSGGTALIAEFPESSLGRYIVYRTDSPFHYINIAYYSLYVLLSIALYARWYRTAGDPRRRGQALVILVSLLAGSAVSSFFGTLLPFLYEELPPPMAPLGMLVWVLGMSIAILKYRLMRLSPNVAAETILRYIRDFVLLCDQEERIIHINQKVAHELGVSPRAVEGSHAALLLPSVRNEPLAYCLGGRDVQERGSELIDAEGNRIPIWLTIMRMRDRAAGEIGFALVAHDLRTLRQLEREKEEHRKTLEQLRKSEETFSSAFHASPVGMAIIDTGENRIEEMNESARRILTYQQDASCSLPSADQLSFLSWVSPSQQQRFRSMLQQEGSVQGVKGELYRCDGSPVEVLISADLIDLRGKQKLLFCFSDLTRTNQLERELVTMQKFESIGLLAGGIAHDFNNLLTAIMGNLSLAKSYTLPDEREVNESIELALTACNHASQLTGQLLTFSTNDPGPSSPVSIGEVIKQSVNLSLSGSDITSRIDDAESDLQVQADRGELVQIFNNLLINAKQAMREAGAVEISIRRYTHPEGSRYSAYAPLSLGEGEYVRISIRDSGPGIPRSRIPHLFDPYFTTKPTGSGLGLSIVYSLVKKYGGEVTVQSTKGEGSTFTVFLPIGGAPGTYGAYGEEQGELPSLRFTETILLMDDEEVIRRVGAQLLEMLGCTVYTEKEGEALLDRLHDLQRREIAVDAIILDLTVPEGMNGLQTVLELRKELTATPIFLTTGYTEHEVLNDYTAYGFNDYLLKPFTGEDLANLLARHLPQREPDRPAQS
jgi:PAS domain S-box-containing protein